MNTIKIVKDSSESPREDDNIGTIAYKHSRYTLGEEQIDDPIDWLAEKLGLEQEQIYRIAEKLDGYYSERMKVYLENLFFEKFVAHRVYLYDHSGLALSTSSFNIRWDSGQIGYIYCTKEKAIAEYGKKILTKAIRERVLQYMDGEIKTYNQYLQGDVYGFQIEDEDGTHLDSCYGFYGTDWKDNGMLSHIDNSMLNDATDEEIIEMLDAVEIEY
jgi:hypothetical protein